MTSPVVTLRGYLEDAYLEDDYLVSYANYAYGIEAELLRVLSSGIQATFYIYNTTQLRILRVFTSRGTAALGGNNWTTTSQAPGDFLPKNLNTDVEEQVFKSSIASVVLTCDTGITQGVTIDTLALRNHNLTTEASVTLQGSKDNFATIELSIPLTPELLNMYYIAPVFPTGTANQNRYWRLIIDNIGGPGYVSIGCIVFGNSMIFSTKESFIQPIKHGLKHFKDELETEGFTADSNDRSLKRYLELQFDKLDRSKGNVRLIEQLVQQSRTSQKCLVIPRPIQASRYAVFAKLTDLPEFAEIDNADESDTRSNAAYVDCSLRWEEWR